MTTSATQLARRDTPGLTAWTPAGATRAPIHKSGDKGELND